MSSDRSWIYGPHLYSEYIKGLDAFIDFIKKDMLDNVRGNLCCPYKHCKNENKYFIQRNKGKQQLKQLPANPKFLTAMMQANTKFVMGRPMLTVDALHKAGKPCVELQNSYINNYMSDQDIILSYKDHHFLVSDDIFLISWFDLYDLFNLNALDVLTHK
jgi:hypothetical protein